MITYSYDGCGTDTSSTVWGYWVSTCDSSTTACTSTSAATVWVKWVNTSSAATTAVTYRASAPPAKVLTPEEREAARLREVEEEAARAERQRVRELQAAERKKAEEEADKRAEELLLAALDAEQKAEYAKDKSFHVRAPTGRRYRIRRAWSGHVERVDGPRRVERLCIHPRVSVPLPDNQLIAKLMIETDEENFRKIANITPLAETAVS